MKILGIWFLEQGLVGSLWQNQNKIKAVAGSLWGFSDWIFGDGGFGGCRLVAAVWVCGIFFFFGGGRALFEAGGRPVFGIGAGRKYTGCVCVNESNTGHVWV